MKNISTRPYPAEAAQHLIATGHSPLLARIYAARGITDNIQLDTALNRLLPFTQFKNLQTMASLLADAIAAQRKLLIVADYDADGATACAVGMRGLLMFGAKVDFIVPNRFEYGYGLTPEIVRLAKQQDPDILLTVDNGISSVSGVAEANRLGMEVFITDHHLSGDQLPEACCIVNPNQHGCDFPSKYLAGVGVMFYVLLALRAELRERGAFTNKVEPNLASLLDLVALGTVADVVRLDENNRILVQQGLQRIRAGRGRAGIAALLQITHRPIHQVAAYDLGFIVGPRLNAAGRLDDMSLGIRCLLTDDSDEATQIAAELDDLNKERRNIEAGMQQEALAALHGITLTDSHTLTLFNGTWHQGVIGILASRLKDKFHRPTIVFAPSNNGEIKGSGRSIPGLHLRDALDLVAKRHPHLLQKFGGHAMAAGLSLREEHFEEFQRAFESVVQGLLSAGDLVKVIETDGELTKEDFSLKTAQLLAQQVWGQGFLEPLFEGEFSVKQQRVVGDKHLKLKLENKEIVYDAILFFSIEELPPTIQAVYSLAVNEYNVTASVQLIVRHWEPTGE
jgi:single-stranded-DNA-specific exonuclease